MNKVIIILGATGVGKSELAVECAKRINGEIISADSMQIYKELNIGTAKINVEQMQGIKHHFLSFKSMFDKYNVWEFVNDCKKTIDEIIENGHTPIIVGGTNLYITALIKNYAFDKAENNFEKQYKLKNEVQYQLYVLNLPREELYKKINSRVDDMFNMGFLEEVKNLKLQGLTTDYQAGKSIGYKELLDYLDNKTTFEYAVDKIKQHSRNYAKRQLTWLRSMENNIWLDVKNKTNNLDLIIKNHDN